MVRVRLNPTERRDQLIELGVKLLTSRALEQISVGEIAKLAGISRGLLFHYFPSKRDFHIEIVRHGNEQLYDRITPDDELTDPIARLRDGMSRYVDFVTENRNFYIALLRGPASADPEMIEIFEGNRAKIANTLVLGSPIFEPYLDDPKIRLAVRGWIAFVEETTISWLREPTITRDELIELNVRALPGVAGIPGLEPLPS
ncbi:TetR/AcrR family transcriptional regulator [Skermania sp. ID1734]|uniref:TetR/AcrR family transcriptional regulator n=1 Tax=Skermania sp. ID1734 TaxID=2597516 RepID=UPI0011814A09|nr:TetR/AcrR family transcriptional regulator [Skermania sp. ID1734]TSE01882.1 TetR/AcrR family transcriptional regulator [Skermania sp. ID1734]